MTTVETRSHEGTQLLSRWKQLQTEQPRLRIRNAAEHLGVSEMALLLCSDRHEVRALRPEAGEILRDLQAAGRVMALSRNEQVVHERHGTYTDFRVSGAGKMGLCLGEIDLRTFLSHWRWGFAVTEPAGEGIRRSLQFFDRAGQALHKVYQTALTDEAAFLQLVDRYALTGEEARAQRLSVDYEDYPQADYPGNGQLTREDVIQPWSELKDVHHFNAMLKRLEIDRLEALEKVSGTYSTRLSPDVLQPAFETLSERGQPVMVFVGNRGIVQIHTGPVHRLLTTGEWFNVLDPDFNLHVHQPGLAQCWLVRRPTADGTVTSLDFFNDRREVVLSLFGPREAGNPEDVEWTQLLESLPQRWAL